MKVLSLDEQELRRKLHNRKVLKKMNRGEVLNSFDSQSSWFPPRPIIKKDRKALEKLYRYNEDFPLRNKKDKLSCKLVSFSLRSC